MRAVLIIAMFILQVLSAHGVFGTEPQLPGSALAGFSIKGQVVDSNSGKPLAFANIVIADSARGAVSDIDGFFEVQNNQPITALQVSHVGYVTKTVHVEQPRNFVLINLVKKPIDLAVAYVYPRENPAHRIIRNVTRNRNANNPEKSGPFSYRSYNKLVFSPANHEQRTLGYVNQNEMAGNDSLVHQHYLLMVETVSDRFFENKLKDNEKVVATRISGFSEPFLAFLATRHQSFSFYNNFVEISGQKYLSPISPGSTERYLFILEKTSFDSTDSVFVISYRPKKDRNFNGIQGILTINSNGWAVQSLTAEPAGKKPNTLSLIRQFYKKVDGKRWFPVQLDIDLEVFNLPLVPDLGVSGRGRTYITNIELEPDFSRQRFSSFAIDLTSARANPGEEFWQEIRTVPLSQEEFNTYRVLDSLGQKRNLDGIFRFATTLLEGKVRVSIVDFYIDEFASHSRLDGIRLGAGLATNHLFSERLRLKGRVSYGLKSNQWRMGYSADLLLNNNSGHRLGFTYSNKTRQRGEASTIDRTKFLSLEMIRDFLIPDLDLVKSNQLWTRFFVLGKQMQVKLFGGTENVVSIAKIYPGHQNKPQEPPQYGFFETGIMLRLAAGERHVATPTRTFVDTAGSPVAFLSVTKGFDGMLNGAHKYLRAEARLDHNYQIIGAGAQNWSFHAGIIWGNQVPWPKLFTAPTSPGGFWPGPPNSFATMNYNEFVSDKYLMLFFRHDFERYLVGKSRLWPRFSVVSNFGIGALKNTNTGGRPNFDSFDKGYFESGIVLSDFFGIGASMLGLQLMYRYGAHSLPTFGENFSARLFVFTLL